MDRQATAEQLRARALDELQRAARLDELELERDQGYRNHETFTVAMQLAGNMTPGGAEYVERVHATVRLGMRRAQTEERETAPVVADTLREAIEAELRRAVRREHPAGVTIADGLGYGLLSAALGRVDWLELATEQLEQLAEGGEQL